MQRCIALQALHFGILRWNQALHKGCIYIYIPSTLVKLGGVWGGFVVI